MFRAVQHRQRKAVAKVRLLKSLGVGTIVVLGPGTGPVPAAEIDTYASYAAEYTDNALLVPLAPTSDLVHHLNVGAFYEQTGKQLEARILADIQYRHYTNGALEDYVIPALDGTQTWFLTPGRFHWFIQDRLKQEKIDPLAAPVSTNQESINVFTTGPTFMARLGPVDSLELEARYTNTFYSQTFEDSDRSSEAVRWKHALSAITDLTNSLEGHRVDFIHGAHESYRVYEAKLGITTRRRQTTIDADIGGTVLDRDVSEDRSRPRGRFSFQYHPNPAALFGFVYEAKYSDLTLDILELPITRGVDVKSGNVYYGLTADLVYARTWAPTKAQFHLYARDRDYIDATPNELAYGSSVNVGHDFSSLLNGNVAASYERIDYVGESPITDARVGLRTTYRLREDLNWIAELRWVRRDSPDPARTYEERAAVLTILYGRRPDTALD